MGHQTFKRGKVDSSEIWVGFWRKPRKINVAQRGLVTPVDLFLSDRVDLSLWFWSFRCSFFIIWLGREWDGD